MSNANGIITAPVSIDDVKTVLGVASNDLATLCQSGKVNMWAKYKPVSYQSIAPLSDDSRKNCNFGLKNIPYWRTIQRMLGWFTSPTGNAPENVPASETEMWDYDKPQGGFASPFRLSDFKDYFHGATAPIGKCTVGTIEETFEGEIKIVFSKGAYDAQHRELRLSDLTDQYLDFSTCYFGIAFLNGTTWYAITTDYLMTDSNIQSYGVGMHFVDSGQALAGKTWKLVPFASSVELKTLQSGYDNAGKFAIIFPGLSNLTIKAMEVVTSQILTAYYQQMSDRTIHVVYTLTNHSVGSISVGEIDCVIMESDGTTIGSAFMKTSDPVSVDAGDYIQYETGIRINMSPIHASRARASINIAGHIYTCQCDVTKGVPRE